MDRLKNPALWLGLSVAVIAAVIHSGLVADGTQAAKLLSLASQVLGVFGSLFFGAGLAASPAAPSPDQKGSARLGLMAVMALVGCATINPIICGKDGHLVPPAAGPCATAFLEAVASIPGDIAACRVGGFSAACIDAVIASGKELTACLPTCAPNAASGRLGVGAPVHVAPNVLRQNVIDSLRASGHPEAGK
jgi:hypothetical protein